MNLLKHLKLDKKLLRELDYITIIAAICIVIFGCVNIYSSTYKAHGNYYVKLQIIFLILGLIMIYLFLLIDYMLIKNYAVILYWAGVIFLIINHFFGANINGARSWIRIGSMAVQPSEFAKIGMIIIIANKLDEMEGNINNPKTFLKLILYAVIPMILIFIQPDMGMTMVSFFMVLGIFFCVGLDWKVLAGGITSIVMILVGAWNSPIIKTYQKSRLTTFLDPTKNLQGSGLQLLQSKMAIGSGRIMGSGFLKGTQFHNIPENHTDFIFAVLGEEWGLIGVILLLSLYGIIIYRLIKIAKESKDIFGSVICVGFVSNLLFSILQNIGMTIGLMPISGVTLPFMSYGGSSILTSFIMLGFVLNIGMRRKKINF